MGIAKFMCREPLVQSVRRFTQVKQQIWGAQFLSWSPHFTTKVLFVTFLTSGFKISSLIFKCQIPTYITKVIWMIYTLPLAYLLTNTKHLHSRQNKMKLHWVHTQWMSVQYWRIYEVSLCMTQQNVQRHDSKFVSFTSCFWAHTASDLIMVNCMWPPSV